MPVVLVALGAVLLTAIIAVYQTPPLMEALQGETETIAGVSALPDVSSPPPGKIATGANEAETSAKAGRGTGLPDLFQDEVASFKSRDEAAYATDSARAERRQDSLADRSNRSGSRATQTGDRYSIPALAAVPPRGAGSSSSKTPEEAKQDPESLRANRSFIRSGSRPPEKRDTTAELAKIVSDQDVSAEEKIEAIEEAIEELDSTGELADIISDQDASAEEKIEAIEEVIEDPAVEPTEEVADAPAEPDPIEEPTEVPAEPDPAEEVAEAPAEPNPIEEPTEVPAEPDPVEEVVYTPAELLEALRDPSPDVYEMAADMLWDLDDPSVASSIWPMFEQYVAIDFDRAGVLLDLLDSLGEEVDEAYELLDYYDPTDWDAIVRQRQQEAATNGVCYAGMICS